MLLTNCIYGIYSTLTNKPIVTPNDKPIKISKPSSHATEIIIEADHALHAHRIELNARAGAVTRKGHALRADNGEWVIALEGEKVRKVSKEAVPLELVPYLAAKDESDDFRKKVLLAGYGFAVTDMHLDLRGRRGRAILDTPWGPIETDMHMAKDGELLRADTGSTGSHRVDAARLDEGFSPPELPGSAAIPVRGKGKVLLVQNTKRQPPPALPGQSVALRKQGWRVEFDRIRTKLDPRIVRLSREVDQLLHDAHDAPGAGADDALSLGRGDCTAHATLFADMAAQQGFETRLVTGYRIDDDTMVRHRWVTVKQGNTWIPVDPTFNEAPAAEGHHLALAVHGDSTAEIALVDEAVFRGFSKVRASWTGASLATR